MAEGAASLAGMELPAKIDYINDNNCDISLFTTRPDLLARRKNLLKIYIIILRPTLMSGSNIQYIDAVRVYERNMPKVRYSDTDETLACQFFLHIYTQITGQKITESDKIVDFGCGSGTNSSWFYRNGYDIHGVDILEYWGKDVHLLGEIGPLLPDPLQAKMFVVDPHNNKLPFADESITMIFSDQTLEHVFDHRAIFAEQGPGS